MPVYKDKNTNKWYVKINYKDKDGRNQQKLKRGFKIKRDALAYEEEFKNEMENSTAMRFDAFVDLYIQDMTNHWKPTTAHNKTSIIKRWILPFFGSKQLNKISVMDVREWHNEQKRSDLAETTQRRNCKVLSSIFNYAVKYYDLPSNPCTKAGTIGTTKREEMEFWTLDEFKEFIQYVKDPEFKLAFETLYFTGLRIGELTALTPADFDFSVPKLSVNKNLQTVKGNDMILSPKTPKSRREVILPDTLALEIQEYMGTIYGGLEDDQRIFFRNKSSYGNKLRSICEQHGLKKIRIHDLRHSHASLLIEMGYSPVMIADRLGHDSVQITLDTYSHLYPNKQKELARDLDKLF